MHEIIFKYFPSLGKTAKDRFIRLESIYRLWNSRINVISRRDFDNFYTHHVLHSLAIAKIISFAPGSKVLDVGTGGGFPGIPLAIMFPDSNFSLLDSIEKKIKVVSAVVTELELENAVPVRKRVEDDTGMFDFILSRAVSDLLQFVKLTEKNLLPERRNAMPNGIFYLKGGDLTGELKALRRNASVWNISDFFSEPFFDTKKVVFIPF